MPLPKSIRRNVRPRSNAVPALPAIVLVALLGSLFAVSFPSAEAGDDKVAPSVPTDLRVTDVSQTSVTVVWEPSTDDIALEGYRVWRHGHREAAKTPETRFTLTGLACGQSLTLQVGAYDGAGNDSDAAKAVVSTAPCVDVQAPSGPSGLQQVASAPSVPSGLQQVASAPSVPTGLKEGSTTASAITVAWSPATDNVAVASYGVFRDGVPVSRVTTTSFTHTGLSCGKTYQLGVAAYDFAGNHSGRADISAGTSRCSDSSPPSKPGGDAQKPSTPAKLVASVTGSTTVMLSWAASSDNVGVAGYDVYANASKIATVTGTSRALIGLACSTAYTFAVEAFDAAGNVSSRATVATRTGTCGSPTPAPPSGGTTRYVSPGGSANSDCTKSAPCGSFDRAYQVASPGDVVQVAGGSYPAQRLEADPKKKSSADVVFQPAPGASVSLGGFWAGDDKKGIGPKHFELRDMKIAGYVSVAWGTEDVTLRNIDAGALKLTSTKDVRVYGGDYGPWVNGVSHINACGVKGCFPAEDILIDGALFHDFTVTDPEKHSECLMIWPGRRVTIRNSTFRNCTDFDILVKPYNTGLVGKLGDILIENNFLDIPVIGEGCLCTRGGNAIAITDGSLEAWSGAVVRYNSSLGGIRFDTAVKKAVAKGNVARKDTNYSCTTTVSFSFNIWSGAKCSPSDRTASLSDVFVNASSASFDLRLKPGSAAVDAGDPSDFPASDRKGKSRPQGGAPDSGADESG